MNIGMQLAVADLLGALDRPGLSASRPDGSGPGSAEEAQARLAALIDSADDAIFGMTLEGIITSWNPGATRILGYSSEEVVGKSMTMLILPEQVGEEPEILAKIAGGERVDHFETIRLRKDGERINVSVSISPIKDGTGKIIGASEIARDITARRLGQDREGMRRRVLFHFEHSGL